MIDEIRGLGLRLATAAVFGLGGVIGAAAGDTMSAHYSVSLMGLHVGEIVADGSLAEKTYRVSLNAHVSGVAAWLTNVKLALASSGTLRRGALAPSAYATSSVSSNETRTLRMALNAGTVKAVEIEPPFRVTGERVPVTDANKRNVLDPTSALFMPVPAKESLVGPSACERTLPIYDGYARFDLVFHYVGTQDFSVPGYTGPVALCSVRYRPISGHGVNSRSTAFMAANDGIQVWLAPVPSAHMVVPIRVSLPTMAGHVDVEATEFNASSGIAETTH